MRKCAGWLNSCEIMRKMLNCAKMCGNYQIVRKVAENSKLCDSAPTAPKSCLWCRVEQEKAHLKWGRPCGLPSRVPYAKEEKQICYPTSSEGWKDRKPSLLSQKSPEHVYQVKWCQLYQECTSTGSLWTRSLKKFNMVSALVYPLTSYLNLIR